MPFLLLLFLADNSYAVTLSKIMSRPEGTSVQTYEINQGLGKLIRKTNTFGPANDLRLGQFNSKSDLKSIEKKITALIPAKDFASPKSHEVYLKVNDKLVDPASPLKPKLEKLFASLQQTEWNFVSGIELSSDLTELSEFEDGKIKNKNIFPQAHHCSQLGKELVCLFKDRGILYVP